MIKLESPLGFCKHLNKYYTRGNKNEIKKNLFSIFILTLTLILSININASAMSTNEVFKKNSRLQEKCIPDALNPIKEKEKLNEYMKKNKRYIYNESCIGIAVDKPIILTFDDGSKIQYKLEIEDMPNTNELYSELISDSPSISTSATITNKTYKVTKTYFVLSGSVDVSIYVECTHSGRSVTINRCYDGFKGSFTRIDSHQTSILIATGYNSSYAKAEGWGSFTYYAPSVGDYFSRSYRIQILVDPAGSAYLKVLD